MSDVRSKLKPGAIALRLDDLLRKKMQVSAIELDLVVDLNECVVEMEKVLAEARDRRDAMTGALGRMMRPDASKAGDEGEGGQYTPSWSDIMEMEMALDQAATSAMESDGRVRELRGRFERALANRCQVLGQEAPAFKRKDKAAGAGIVIGGGAGRKASTKASAELAAPSDYDDMGSMSEAEVAGALLGALGGAALSGAKGAFLTARAVADTLGSSPAVADSLGRARESSSGVGRGISELRDGGGNVDSYGDGDEELVGGDGAGVQDTLSSAGETLGYVSDAVRAVASEAGSTDSARLSKEALMDTSRDLMSAASAFAALGAKAGAKAMEAFENRRKGEDGDDK